MIDRLTKQMYSDGKKALLLPRKSPNPPKGKKHMIKKLIIVVSFALLANTSAHAIDAKYREKLERSGCTQMSEMQGCDINKTRAENARAGFVTEAAIQSPYAGEWVAVGSAGGTVSEIHIDSNEQVKVNGEVVKAKRSDGALVFTQGFITYTIQGDRTLKDEDYWYDSDAGTRGRIHAK